MSTKDGFAKYVRVLDETYSLVIDAFSAATRSRLSYWKSIWDIVSRPYAAKIGESTLEEASDCVKDLVNLTIEELHARGQRTTDFSEKFLVKMEQLQAAARDTYRESLIFFVSGVEQVKEVADSSANGLKPRSLPAERVSPSR